MSAGRDRLDDMNERWAGERLHALRYASLPPEAHGQLADPVFAWLIAQYGQPWRVYHTLEHIERMLSIWDEVAEIVTVEDRSSLALAIWFHDAIYDPKRQDNEVRSAEEATRRLAPLGVSAEALARVHQMILATATHQSGGADTDTAFLLDLDLATLGAEPAEYDAYARAIRQEYGHVSEADYRAGRTQVLHSFLERQRIYVTGPMAARYERRARENLEREIAGLDAVVRAQA